jgi:aerobic-type carbon monoxide dehydrogenase small subunit (CoxS/CutS family)
MTDAKAAQPGSALWRDGPGGVAAGIALTGPAGGATALPLAPASLQSKVKKITINGAIRQIEVPPGTLLVDVLRDNLRLTGTKDACRCGECGSCTVLVGGKAVLSCLSLVALVEEPVETVEGLVEESRAFREAMADCGGFQCGYCTSGVVVRAVELLRAGLPQSDEGLARAMAGNLCRCTGYRGILEALRQTGASSNAP